MAMHPLGELIERRMKELRPTLSIGDVARMSGIGRSRVHQLINDPIKTMPGTDTIKGIAVALKIPESVVVDAVLATLGLPRGSSSDELYRKILIAVAQMDLDDTPRREFVAHITRIFDGLGDNDGTANRTAG